MEVILLGFKRCSSWFFFKFLF